MMGMTRSMAGRGLSSVVALVFITLMPHMLTAQVVQVETVKKFADQALADYVANVVTEANASRLGFRDAEAAAEAKLGDPFPVTFIALGDLKEYTRDTSIDRVVRSRDAYWFPVRSGSGTVAQLEVLHRDGRWLAGDFGKPVTASTIGDVQDELPTLAASEGIAEPYQTSLVMIPVLNASFIRVSTPDTEYLVPAVVSPERLQLENGTVYLAEDLLEQLRTAVSEIDGKKVM